MRKLFVLAAVVAMLLATTLVAYADGNADAVVAYNPGPSAAPTADPSKAVDDVDNTWVSLGTSGNITVRFVDNVAVDGPGADIRIRDRCGGIEEIEVLVSHDGVTFVSLGTFDDAVFTASCSPPNAAAEADLDIDLSSYPAAPSFVSQVKIVDQGETDVDLTRWFGFDLENVWALNSALPVEIDIKPGSDPNCINPDSNGVIPVAILGSATFDASTVDPLSVVLDGGAVRLKGKSGNAGALEDVNSDGFLDLVVHIMDVSLSAGSATATLTATADGTPIAGADSICIVP